MRDSYILGFRYKYVNAEGKAVGLVKKTGSVTRDGISLHDQRIFLRDVYKTGRDGSRLIISLKPYASTTKEICDHILPKYNALVIDIDEVLAEKVKSVIDRQCTAMIARDNWGHLTREQRDKQFQRIECPKCDAILDITNLPDSNYVYCKYCESILDKFGYLSPGSDEYKICPECNYYGRVQDYYELSAYALYQDTKFQFRKIHCCDTCAHRIYKRNVWKNLTLIFGSAFTIFEKLRSKRERNALYKGLQEAVYLAQNGNMVESDVIFSDIVLRNDRHPGVYYNYGRAFLENGDKDKAAFQFKKSLDACSNYLPTINLIKKNIDVQELMKIRSESDKEI